MNPGLLETQNDHMIDWIAPVNWLHPLNRGLVSWWLCVPGAMGGTKWQDLCKRNHGTLTNMDPATDWVPSSRPGGSGAIDFVTDDYINIGNLNAVFNGLNAWAISGWVRPNVLTGSISPFLGSAEVSSHPALRFDSATELRGFAGNGTGLFADLTTSGITFVAGTWYHIVYTYNGTSANIYVDGVSRMSGGLTGTLTNQATTPHRIGGGYNASIVAFNGQIDCCRIRNRAMTASDVVAEFALDKQSYPGLLNLITPWYYGPTSSSGTVTATAACTIGGISCSAAATFAPGTKTATAAPTIGGIQASAAATHTAPSFTATAAPTIGGVEVAAAGTFAEGTFTATAAPTVGGATCAIAATFVAPVFTASAAPSIGGVEVAAAGTFTAPVFTATAAPTIGGVEAAIAATFATETFTATIGVEAGGATAAVSATFAPGTKTATAAPTIGGATAAVSATFTPPSFTATVSVTCAAAIAAAAAEFAESVGLSPVDGFFAQERTRGFTADRRVRGFYATERTRGFVGSKP